LNPRLTSRHVHLPGFVLILSLIAFEHLFGFVGFFLSFPALFVAGRIRAEFLEEEGKLATKKLVEVPKKEPPPKHEASA
jgi:predicted PurR-regulated permease PerM